MRACVLVQCLDFYFQVCIGGGHAPSMHQVHSLKLRCWNKLHHLFKHERWRCSCNHQSHSARRTNGRGAVLQ